MNIMVELHQHSLVALDDGRITHILPKHNPLGWHETLLNIDFFV